MKNLPCLRANIKNISCKITCCISKDSVDSAEEQEAESSPKTNCCLPKNNKRKDSTTKN